MRIRWTRRALRNLENIGDFIAQDRPMAARRVLERVEQAVERLTHFPEMGRTGRVSNTRELVVPRTPLIVAYRVRDEVLELLAVFHGARQWPDEL